MRRQNRYSLYEEYLLSASIMFQRGEEAQELGNEEESVLLYRSCVFFMASAMEAFLNWLADIYEEADALTSYEIDFLCDRTCRINPVTGQAARRTEYHSAEDKIRYLLARFHVDFPLTTGAWADYKAFRQFRDEIVHPRENSAEHSLKQYNGACRKGIRGTLEIMNAISKRLFKKGLRKRLLDIGSL